MTAGRNIIGKSKDWGTPKKYVDAVKRCFGGRISLDPCSNAFSIVHADTEFMLPEHDGLKERWKFPTIYVNPPYGLDPQRGRTISDWLRKCEEAHRVYGSEVIALIPVATNTGHWKKYIFGRADGICFLYDTRLRFLESGEDTGKGAPMSCAMAYWGEHLSMFSDTLMPFGATVNIQNLKGVAIGQAHAKQTGQQVLIFSEPNEGASSLATRA